MNDEILFAPGSETPENIIKEETRIYIFGQAEIAS